MAYRTIGGGVLGALLLLALVGARPTHAQTSEAGVSIELNKLEALADRCRAYLVLENGMRKAFGAKDDVLKEMVQKHLIITKKTRITAPS